MPLPKSLLKGFEKAVATVRPDPKKRLTIFDEATTGLCLLVSPKGRKTFTLVARGPASDGKPGKQVWKEIGNPSDMSVEQARVKARAGLARIKAGGEPFPTAVEPEKPETFNDVAENFLNRHVKKMLPDGEGGWKPSGEPALRSAKEIERQIDKFFCPKWGATPFADIKRSDVAKVLQRIADERGPVMADRALATLSMLFKMHTQFMPDEWQPPLMLGMRRTKATARAGTRILADEDDFSDLRLVWSAAEQSGGFGAFVQILLLTGQRRAKVAGMRWADMSPNGVWTIPTEPGEKGNATRITLPKLALDIIRAQPEIEANPYVFAARAKKHIAGFGPLKAKLDKKVREANGDADVKPWTLHDLRRTAKSLMQWADVRPDISEAVLGHHIAGIERTYGRHKFQSMKNDALEKLAALVERIVTQPAENVVALAGRGK